jgi:hypothetical protein
MAKEKSNAKNKNVMGKLVKQVRQKGTASAVHPNAQLKVKIKKQKLKINKKFSTM